MQDLKATAHAFIEEHYPEVRPTAFEHAWSELSEALSPLSDAAHFHDIFADRLGMRKRAPSESLGDIALFVTADQCLQAGMSKKEIIRIVRAQSEWLRQQADWHRRHEQKTEQVLQMISTALQLLTVRESEEAPEGPISYRLWSNSKLETTIYAVERDELIANHDEYDVVAVKERSKAFLYLKNVEQPYSLGPRAFELLACILKRRVGGATPWEVAQCAYSDDPAMQLYLRGQECNIIDPIKYYSECVRQGKRRLQNILTPNGLSIDKGYLLPAQTIYRLIERRL